MPTPSLLLRLSDARQYRAALADARVLVPALSDARQYRAALAVAPLPETGVGGVLSVSGRVPMLTASGTPAPYWGVLEWSMGGATIEGGAIQLAASPVVESPTSHRYVPGQTRPANRDGFVITDALGATVTGSIYWNTDPSIPLIESDVVIGEDGICAPTSGGQVQLTASGGEGPYTWALTASWTGGSVDASGLYTAGPAFGADKVQVTDSLGAVGYITIEVLPRDIANTTDLGIYCLPWANVSFPGSTAPYVVEWTDNDTDAVMESPKNLRACVRLCDLDGAPLDLTGWAFAATLYSQRGAVLADGLAVAVAGGLLEVDLPDPATLPLDPAVLRITATTAGAVLALGYTTTAIEVLLVARPET